jgi:hypothetical protein
LNQPLTEMNTMNFLGVKRCRLLRQINSPPSVSRPSRTCGILPRTWDSVASESPSPPPLHVRCLSPFSPLMTIIYQFIAIVSQVCEGLPCCGEGTGNVTHGDWTASTHVPYWQSRGPQLLLLMFPARKYVTLLAVCELATEKNVSVVLGTCLPCLVTSRPLKIHSSPASQSPSRWSRQWRDTRTATSTPIYTVP